MEVVEDNRLVGQPVQVRRLYPLAAIGGQIIRAKRIRYNQDHVEIVPLLLRGPLPMRAAVLGGGGRGPGTWSREIGRARKSRAGLQ